MGTLGPLALPQQGKTFSPKTEAAGVIYSADLGPVYYDGTYFLFYRARIEVVMKATTGTVYARLWDATESVEVDGSVISTDSGSLIRVRSSLFAGLVSGREYMIQGGHTAGDAGAWKSARFLIYEGEP